MQYDHVLLVRIHTIERGVQVIERVVIAYHHQNIPRPYAKSFRGEVVTGLQIELVQFGVGRCALLRLSFGDAENGEENKGKAVIDTPLNYKEGKR